MSFLPHFRHKTAATADKNKEIASYFTKGVEDIPADHSFEAGLTSNVSGVVNGVIEKFMVPWLIECLNKYSEPQFHHLMAGSYMRNGQPKRGMDFLADWYANHPKQFKTFLWVARRNRRWVKFNLQDQQQRLVYVIKTHSGWQLLPHEIQCFNETLQEVYRLIYS